MGRSPACLPEAGSTPVFSTKDGSLEPPFSFSTVLVDVSREDLTTHPPWSTPPIRSSCASVGLLVMLVVSLKLACKTLLISWLRSALVSVLADPTFAIDRSKGAACPFRRRPEKLARSTFEEGYGRECGGRVFGTPGPARDDLSVGRLSPPLHSSSKLTAPGSVCAPPVSGSGG